MYLPAIYEFFIEDNFIDFFNKKFDYCKRTSFLEKRDTISTVGGIQTGNLLDLNEDDINISLDIFKTKIEVECQCDFEYHWAHMIEYDYGGFQSVHNHEHNEDLSAIVYLNTCEKGETYFLLNEKRDIIKRIYPERGKCVIFLSSINHGSNYSEGGKKVLVLGLRVKKF